MQEILAAIKSLESAEQLTLVKQVVENFNSQQIDELSVFLRNFNQSSIVVDSSQTNTNYSAQNSTTKEPQFVKNEYLVSGSFVSINTGFSLNISNSSFVQVQQSTDKDYRVFIILVAILRIIK
jgi:hypothetical protein